MTKFVSYGSKNQILASTDGHHAIGVIVSDEGVDLDASGRKIIPQGTTVGGSNSVLQNEQEVLKVVADGTAQGVLEFPVDVSDGQGNGTMLIHGYVNLNRLPDGVTVADEAKAAIPGVVFMKRDK